MAYIYISKTSKEVREFGSIKCLSDKKNIPIDNLYTIFSRNKSKEHETNEFRIVKTKIERA